MKILKKIIISVLIFLVIPVLIAAGAYLFMSDATLVPLMSNYLESATGTRITYHNDAAITRTLSPSFHATNLIIEDENKGFSAQFSSLQLQVSLLSLFSGKLDVPVLILGDTRIESKRSNSLNTLSIPESLPIVPIFHDIQISKLTMNHEGKDLVLLSTHLNELSMAHDQEIDTFVAFMDIDLDGDKVHINAEFPQIHEVLKSRHLIFVASAKSSDNVLSTKGNIDFSSSPPTIQASVLLQAPDLQHISTGLRDFIVQGSLAGQAAIAGTFEKLTVKDISATWQGPQQSEATVHGAIDNVMQMSGCELKVDSHLEGGSWLIPVLPKNMGPLQSADITALVTCTDQRLKIADFSLRAKTMDELDLSVTGQFYLARDEQSGVTPENIDLKLKFSAPTTRTARLLFFEKIWEFGPITGTANIRSSKGDPGIEKISLLARDPQGLEVGLTGRIDRFPLNPGQSITGYDLAVTMKSKQSSIMMDRLGLALPLSGPLQIAFKIEGDTQALQLNKIKFKAGKAGEIYIVSAGSLLFGDWALVDPLTNVDLSVQVTSSDTHALGTLWGKPLPEFGPLAAQGLVHTVSGKHRIDNFQLLSSGKSPLQASIKGSADHVVFFGQPGIQGIQLRAAATAADTAQLNSIFALQRKIPAMGPFKASGVITGDHGKLAISNFAVSAGKDDTLLIDVHGDPGVFSAANDWHPRETNLSISARATSSHSFFDLLGLHLPELGTVTANAGLKEKDNKLILESASMIVGDATDPSLDASGHINDLMAFAGVDFDVSLNLGGHILAALADNIKLPDMKPLTGKIVISDSDGTLGIDTFQVRSIGDNLFSIDATGHFDDFKHPDTLSITTHLTARDLQLIGALFDAQWPEIGPVQLDSKIQPTGKSLEFQTTFSAGELKLHSEISGLFHSNPPQISGKITAQNFYLPSLEEFGGKDIGSEKLRKDKIFSPDPINFNWLKKADLDLSLEIDSFDKQRSHAQSGQFKIVVQSGEMKISPGRLVYPKGELNFDIELDVREQPKVKLEAYGKDLNPWHALDMKSSAASKDFDTDLDIQVQVTSSGSSEKELAANLQGEIYMNMKNGKMRRSLLDLVFLDIAGWTVSKVSRDKDVDVDVECGVADYSIKDGIMDTKGLFIDTKSISITGEGTIDLAREKIDYVFLPKKKSNLIIRADPVNIKGPLNNPSISAIPVMTAITTYGSLFFAPYLFAGVYAADLLSGIANVGANSSPCLEYERKHIQEDQSAGH